MIFHPLSLTVDLSNPSFVQALRVRVYLSPRTPTSDPVKEVVIDAPAGGFLLSNIVDLAPTGLFDTLAGFWVDLSVSGIGALVSTESLETFADNNSVLVAPVIPVAAPISAHINY